MADRSYDVVLFGPTGVTGREVARHLARRAPAAGLRWAAAGRDRARVSDALAAVGAAGVDVLLADTDDAASIDALAADTTVVANLVGPYATHGEVVYRACVRHGTHELDLTGEVDWVRTMIDQLDGPARETGARIVPCAGFESLPFDLGALLAARTAWERHGQPVKRVDVAVTMSSGVRIRRPSDAVSGGTFRSGLGALRRGGGADGDARSLDPSPHPEADFDLRARRHAGTGAWLAPMVPSPYLNPPVAHRTAALLRADGDPTFASDYRFREGLDIGAAVPGPLAPVVAAAVAGAQAGSALFARAPQPVRSAVAGVLERLGPQPGDGPDPDQLDRWSYRLDVQASTTGGRTVDVTVHAAGHPGYKSTATMVGEAALILADPGAPVPDRAGILTPATALGVDVLDRFAAAGAVFVVS